MEVKIEDAGRVRKLILNRPEFMNAFNNAQYKAVSAGLKQAEEDSKVAVVLITGEGRAFSAGQDLSEMQRMVDGGRDTYQFPGFLAQLTAFRKPLIAAVNGGGVGIGMTMLGHCDLVLMSNTARLRTPFPQLGLAPEAGSSGLFPMRMGWQNAAYTLLSGKWLSAQDAYDAGYVWKVCEPQELLEQAMAVATDIAANPIPSLIATKELMLASGRLDLAKESHAREVEAYKDLVGAPANREAIAAFFERREPDFSKVPGA
jgi:enoyl-CoA hydratase/carnithine racemase